MSGSNQQPSRPTRERPRAPHRAIKVNRFDRFARRMPTLEVKIFGLAAVGLMLINLFPNGDSDYSHWPER